MNGLKLIVVSLLIAFVATVSVRSRNRHRMIDPFDQQCTDAGLGRQMEMIDLTGLTPRRAFELLRKMTGAEIQPDWESLRRAGITPDDHQILSLRLYDLTVEKALGLLLGVDGGFDVDHGVIRLASRTDLAHVCVIHDLRSIIPAGEFSRSYVPPPDLLRAQWREAQMRLMIQQNLAGTRPSRPMPPAPVVLTPTPPLFRTFGDLQALLVGGRVTRELYDEWFWWPARHPAPLQRAPRIQPFDSFLFVYQTRQRQREIRRLLAEEAKQRVSR